MAAAAFLRSTGWAHSPTATAYAALFWPTFETFEGYVFRAGYDLPSVRAWEAKGADRKGVEAATNTLHFDDLFFCAEKDDWNDLSDARAIAIGRAVAEAHELKLKRDFPERTFVVEFWDGSQPGGGISMSFWQG